MDILNDIPDYVLEAEEDIRNSDLCIQDKIEIVADIRANHVFSQIVATNFILLAMSGDDDDDTES